jgi:hypothetical protein
MIVNAAFWSLFDASFAIFKQARNKLTFTNAVYFLFT